MANNIAHLNAEQVARGEHKRFDPERHDFRWNADFTEVDVIALEWWDDASYAAYQGDLNWDDRPPQELCPAGHPMQDVAAMESGELVYHCVTCNAHYIRFGATWKFICQVCHNRGSWNYGCPGCGRVS